MKDNGKEGFIDFNGHKVWYSIYGSLDWDVLPLVGLHGGPGYPHYHIRNISELSRQGIPVILYDQLGCGNSDTPDDPSLWTVQLFIDELKTIRKELGLNKINLLGHSWGGSLATEYILREPDAVNKLILSSPLLDTELWISETDKLKDQLSPEVAATMRKHEQEDTTNSEEYENAYAEFRKEFLCRLDPYPKLMKLSDKHGSDQVYETMWGPSEACSTGVLKTWSILDRLHNIKSPTLLLSGKYDEATPTQMKIAKNKIPGSKWIMFENSSHTANLEEPKAYLETVSNFINEES